MTYEDLVKEADALYGSLYDSEHRTNSKKKTQEQIIEGLVAEI